MKHHIPTFGLLGLAMFATMQAQTLTIYTGSISSSEGTLFGTEAWETGSSVSWTIQQNNNGSWLYNYNFDVAAKDISHFIVETCGNFSASDVLTYTDSGDELGSMEFGTYTADRSNPGLPGSIYGFKVDTNDDASTLSLGFSFTTYNAPAWQNVYLKDGKDGGSNVYAFNSGFDFTDPVAPASNGSLHGHILAPGCVVSIPEPNVSLFGLLGVLGILRRRR